MKVLKKVLVVNFIVLTLLTMPIVSTNLNVTSTVQAASSIKISKKKKTLRVGDKYTLKITGTSKKVKWKSSNKKVATVNSKGKVKAKKKGTATITAKVGGKKYKCKITVKKAKVLKVGKYTLKYGTYKGSGINYNSNEKYSCTFKLNSDGTCSYTLKIGNNTEKYKGTYKVTRDSWYGIEYTGEAAAFDGIETKWSNGYGELFAVGNNTISAMEMKMKYVGR